MAGSTEGPSPAAQSSVPVSALLPGWYAGGRCREVWQCLGGSHHRLQYRRRSLFPGFAFKLGREVRLESATLI